MALCKYTDLSRALVMYSKWSPSKHRLITFFWNTIPTLEHVPFEEHWYQKNPCLFVTIEVTMTLQGLN
jgi:hypothetical protein